MFFGRVAEIARAKASSSGPQVGRTRSTAFRKMFDGGTSSPSSHLCTTLSEGRGTTRPLETLGAPDLDADALLEKMQSLEPAWLRGCRLRACWFEPTFHKHAGKLCAGLQIHVEAPGYAHDAFRPWRLVGLAFKALRMLRSDYPLWRDFPYEYETRLPIDVINGGSLLREWVDDPAARPGDLDAAARADEDAWREEREAVLLYR